MTNEELISKIREEIERMKIDYLNRSYTFVPAAMEQLLSFLSTLEEQPKEVRNPIFDECVANVDQEVREEVRRNIDFEQELYNRFGQIKDFTLGMRIGQYFYELGCRRTAEKYDEIEYNRQREEGKLMDLEERIGSYNIVPYIDDKIAKLQDMWREEKVSFDWDDLKDMIEDVASHFAEWGAEHLKK